MMHETVIDTIYIKNAINDSKFNSLHLAVFVLCLLSMIGEGYNIFLYGSVLPVLVAEWSLSSVQAGLIGSYGLIGMMIGSAAFGWMADKVGRKVIIMVCVALYSIFTALGGFAPDAVLFSVFRFMAGLGFGGVIPNVVALATDYTPKRLQYTLVPFVPSGMQIGGMFGPIVSLATIDRYSWRAVLWIGGIFILLIPIMAKFMPDSAEFLVRKKKVPQIKKVLKSMDKELNYDDMHLSDESNTGKKSSIKSLFVRGRALNSIMFCCTYFMSLLILFVLGTWLPALMIRMGYEFNASLIFPIILNVGCIIGIFIFTRIADKLIPVKKLLIILFIIAACSMTLLGFKYATIILYILVFITGACTYGTQNLTSAFVSQYYPAHMRSTGLGVCMGAGRVGAFFGTTLWGIILQMNLPPYMNFMMFAIPALIAAGSLFIVKERREVYE